MPRKARVISTSGIYHIILRGANRQEIFHDEADCEYFLYTLKKYKAESQIKVFSWCLMNNHVHLLLKEGNEAISTTMKRIGVAYVWYYNWKYTTTGHLFQDRFRSENVETIRYLFTVVRYIHQNPLKAGLVLELDEWKWSSFLGYLETRVYPAGLLDSDYILGMFANERDVAIKRFEDYHARTNMAECLDVDSIKRRMTDNEAKKEIIRILGPIEIAQVKSLPRLERGEILRRTKEIEGISHRQIARIYGVSASLVFRA